MAVGNFEKQILGDRYQIELMIGQGGMAAVYKANDPNLRRTVAIKVIHTHLSNDPDFVRRFEEEATAVARLRHANIVQVFDYNHDDDLYYMVMEFIPGETLQSRLKRLNQNGRRLPVKDAIQFSIDICEAADYAHQRGMIHRDIKPANVMLDVNNKAILMDFGIARMVGGQQHTATGAVVGTALYMAPEQIQGLHADARADIYSLGVTLFESLSGRPPFEADFGDDGDDDAPQRPGAGRPPGAARSAPCPGGGTRKSDRQESGRAFRIGGRDGSCPAPGAAAS